MKVLFKLGMGAVVILFDGGFFQGTVHPFDLAIGPGVIGLRQAMFNAVLEADPLKGVNTPLGSRAVSVRRQIAKLNAVIGQYRVDGIRDGRNQVLQKGDGRFTRSPITQFGIGELAGAVNGHEQVQLAFLGTHFGDIDVEVAYRIALEALLVLGCRFIVGQTADAVALVTTVQTGSGQMGDTLLEGIEAIVQRQKGQLSKGHTGRFFFTTQDRGTPLFRTHRRILGTFPVLPFEDGLFVDPVASGQNLQALLTMLDLPTNRLCRSGAAVE